MTIYKIKNKEKKEKIKNFLLKLKKLKKQRLKTIQSEITPFEWSEYLGFESGLDMLPTYLGFKPKAVLEKPPEGWRFDKDHSQFLVPSKRYKKGKEIGKKLENLENFSFYEIERMLNLKLTKLGRFTIPKLYLSKNKKAVYLVCDSSIVLESKEYKEVTKKHLKSKL